MTTTDQPTRTHWAANHVRGRWRVVGGRLSVEGDRLVFHPGSVDRVIGENDWSAALADIEDITVMPRRTPRELRRRRRLLRITANGEPAYFVVNRQKRVAAELDAHRTARTTGTH